MESLLTRIRKPSSLNLVLLLLCLGSAYTVNLAGYKGGYVKRYAMMDLALSQIYDLCDTNGDRMLTYPEFECVQDMGNKILGKRRK